MRLLIEHGASEARVPCISRSHLVLPASTYDCCTHKCVMNRRPASLPKLDSGDALNRNWPDSEGLGRRLEHEHERGHRRFRRTGMNNRCDCRGEMSETKTHKERALARDAMCVLATSYSEVLPELWCLWARGRRHFWKEFAAILIRYMPSPARTHTSKKLSDRMCVDAARWNRVKCRLAQNSPLCWCLEILGLGAAAAAFAEAMS